MLKNALSNGHSSQVRGWLLIDGVKHELAQVGPDFCILREPISSDFVYCDTQADLIIEVDGNQRQVVVLLSSNNLFSPKRLEFRTVQVA